MAYNIFNDNTTGGEALGKRLTNIKNLTISGPRFSVYDSNNTVSTYSFNPAVADILNQSSLDALKTILLDNTEEAIVYTANSSDIMEFHTGLAGGAPSSSNLRLEITNTDTTIKNNLVVDGSLEINNIKTASITTSANDHGFYLYNNPTSNPVPSKQYYFRFIPTASNFVQTESNYLTFSPVNSGAIGFHINHNTPGQQVTSNYNFRINVPNNNDYALFVAPGNNQACLYSGKQYVGRIPSGLLVQGFFEQADTNQERCALKINNYSNGGYRPLCINSANQSKVIFCSDNLHSSDAQKFIVDSDSLFSANVNINGNLTNANLLTTNIKDINDVDFINLNSDIVIKKNITPDTTNTLDIGSTTKRINNVYVNVGNFSGNVNINGNLTNGNLLTTNIKDISGVDFINLNSDIIIKKNIFPETTSTLDIGSTTKLINNAYVNAGNYSTLKTGGDTTAIESGYALEVGGDTYLKGSILLNANSTYSIGEITKKIDRIYTGGIISSSFYDSSNSEVFRFSSSVMRLYKPITISSTVQIDLAQSTSAFVNGYITNLYSTTLNTSTLTTTGDITIGGVSNFNGSMITQQITPISNTYSLGSSSKSFLNGYISNVIGSSLTTTGDITIAGVGRFNGGINSPFDNVFSGGIQFLNSMIARQITPNSSGSYSLGTSGKRFLNGYFTGDVICDVLTCNSGTVGGNTLTSDIRIKENIKLLEDDFGIDFIRKLKPKEYKYKTGIRKHLGFIANDLYDILKTDQYSIWSKLKDEIETQCIQPMEFIAPIVKSVQHLDDKIGALEKKVNKLENMNKTLIQLIEKLIKK